jgi:methylmalonyl-CoA epimerase
MRINKIDHIGIAVKKIEEAVKFYSATFGLKVSKPIEVPSQKVKIAFMEIGEVKLELLEPLGEDSPILKFIQKRGEGLHHICFQVEDIDQALEELKNKNVKLIDQNPRMGATGKRIAFLHPDSVYGVLIELKEK